MKYLKKFETTEKDKSGNELVDAVCDNKYYVAKNLLDSGFKVDSVAKTNNTPLLYAAYQGKWNFVFLLLKYNPTWEIKDSSNTDFIDYINQWVGGNKVLENIIKCYPERYQEYISKKEALKYNL